MAIANGFRLRQSHRDDYISLKFSTEDVERLRLLKKEVKVPQVHLLGWLMDDREKLAQKLMRVTQENLELKKLIRQKIS